MFRPRDSRRECNTTLRGPRTTQGVVGNVAVTTGIVDFAATLDNSQSGYVESGTGWVDGSGTGAYLGNSRQHAAGSGESTASWQFSDLPAGQYKIYATWPAADDQATNAPFTVYDGSSVAGTERVDQQIAPRDETADGMVWQLVGTYSISSGQMTVELSDDANKVRWPPTRFGSSIRPRHCTGIRMGTLPTITLPPGQVSVAAAPGAMAAALIGTTRQRARMLSGTTTTAIRPFSRARQGPSTSRAAAQLRWIG